MKITYRVHHLYDAGIPFSNTVTPELIEVAYSRLHVLLGVRLLSTGIEYNYVTGVDGMGPSVELSSNLPELETLNLFASILRETSNNYLGICLVGTKLA